MYRIINVNSREVLSLDNINTIAEARRVAEECESHESQPETRIEMLLNGEWVPAGFLIDEQ